MSEPSETSQRKSDHIRINLQEDVQSALTTGLERYSFTHQALPELDLDEIDLTLTLFGHTLPAPLFISSMTGGTQEAGEINRRLAAAAQETGIPMGVGSQRAALEDPSSQGSYQLRHIAPDILLFANLGAVQLNEDLGVDECRKVVEMAGADALILHLNPLQEAVQPEGETNFAGLTEKIRHICAALDVPVIVKEVGWGLSEQAAQALVEAGVSALDVAGAGGTSWSEVEMHRAETEMQRELAASFIRWGIPTAESIQMVREVAPGIPLFASGGLRTGTDIAKCIALGATMGGMASPFLKAASHSTERSVEVIRTIIKEIQITMFAAGVKDLNTLAETPLRAND
ncbi:MAG: type 2 isopentenyl-diphosphate Delta-isomerase [Anaerolineales bacterium]